MTSQGACLKIVNKSKAEERISELEDKMVELTSEEQNKVKRMERTEDSLRDLWDNIKHTNIQMQKNIPSSQVHMEPSPR